ncbi:type IV pilus modification protein PilV [Aeromonas sp. 164P]
MFIGRYRGFSLLEVMIAVLILGVGLLGMATLQLQALRSGQAALNSTEVTQAANLVVDLMRANRGAALSGQYDLTLGEQPAGSSQAADDLRYWRQMLTNLPSGDGSILVVQGRVTVTIQWSPRPVAGEEDLRSFELRADL